MPVATDIDSSQPPLQPCASQYLSPELCAKLRELKLDFSPRSVLGRNLLFCGPVKIGPDTTVLRLKIDAYSQVYEHSYVATSSIGRYCTIGNNVGIGVGNHDISGLTSSNNFQINSAFRSYTGTPNRLNPSQMRSGEDTSEVTIGHDVFVGTATTIVNNITIGTGAVIGAGSVITSDVPPYAVVAGKGGGKNSHGIIKRYRFSDEAIADLLELQWRQYDLPQLMLQRQQQGQKLPIGNIKDFTALMRNEDLSLWPKIEDKWLYLAVENRNQVRILQTKPDINMGHLYPDSMRTDPSWQ